MIRNFLRHLLDAFPPLQSAVDAVRVRRSRSAMIRKADLPLPTSVAIELTNNCNLRCAKCPTYEAKRVKGFMDEGLFRKILKDIEASDGPVEIALSGAGDPTLHERVVECVRLACLVPNTNRVGFATNAVELTPELSKRLLDAGLNRLKVSLDTDDPRAYLKINRVDAYETVKKNVIEFCALKKAGGYDCDVELKITLYGDDLETARRLRDFWSPHVDRVRATGLHNWVGLRGRRKGGERTQPCRFLWEHIQILWDGQITLCCNDSMEGFFNMGNAWDLDISEYWRHDTTLLKIRAAHLAGDFLELPICAACNADQYKPLFIA